MNSCIKAGEGGGEEEEDNNDESGTENEVKAGNDLHCGCWTNDTLLGFYLWKFTQVKSHSTDARAGWKEDLLDRPSSTCIRHHRLR